VDAENNIHKHAIQQKVFGIIDFLKNDIWKIRLEELPFGKSFLIKQLRVFILAIRGFVKDKCLLQASALTFYTLLSIVPVAAMFFGIAKGFGFEKILQQALYDRFPGQQEMLTQVINFALALLEHTKGGVIAGIGLAVLFWSVIKVLNHIEAALNDIWAVKEPRSWGRKFSDYLSIMLISPILVLLSGSTTVFITTQVTQITEKVELLGMVSPLIFFSLKLVPYALVWLLFTVLYIMVPNTKVSFKAGLIGGVVGGTIYQLAQVIYINFQINTTRYNAIYGSFAALPLFLMWVQISWYIVLFGAELAFANQNVNNYEYGSDSLKISPGHKKLLTLQIAHLVVKTFSKAEKPLTDLEISRRLKMPIRLVQMFLHDLVQSTLVSETRIEMEKEFGYQPACDTNLLTLNYVIEALERNGDDSVPMAETEELAILSKSLQQFSEAMEKSPANKLLRDI
jgi:membrane protein